MVAVIATAACTSNPPPPGPSETCTSFESETRNIVADAGSTDDGIIADFAPDCIPFSATEVNAGLSCTVFATFYAQGDESVCESSGLQTPDATTLDQLRSNQESEWKAAGGADSGTPDPSTLPTCVIPRLLGTDLDALGSCTSSPKAGWCLTTGSAAGSCMSEIVFSPNGRPNRSLITIACEMCGD
jgi:hypothetical protein